MKLSPFALGALITVAATTSHAQQSAPRLTRPPRLVQFVEADFPATEHRAASVVLRLRISATGSVDEATVTQSAGAAFDEAAVRAARAFRFEPAEIDGRPAPIRIEYRYEFTLRVEAPTTAIFSGVVRHRATRRPLANVTITLEGGGETHTDAEGVFRFDSVSPGERAVTVSGPSLTTQRVRETFVAGSEVHATYDVQPTPPASAPSEDSDDLEIVVTAPPIRRAVTSTEMTAEQARRVPGTQGDVLRVVENLPGVARASVGTAALVVWGAAPEDTRVYVDGVPIPRLYHDGGLRSVLASDLVSSVELVPGGYGAAYGRGLGGVVLVSTRSTEPRGAHGSYTIDALDLAASARVAINERVRVSAALRRSHLDSVFRAVGAQVDSYLPVPRYWDGQLRVGYHPGANESAELTALFSTDSLTRGTTATDPTRSTSERRSLDFVRVYGRYRRLADGAEITVTPWVGTDHSRSETVAGAVPTSVESESLRFGIRASYRARIRPWFTFEAGVDAEGSRTLSTRDGSIASPSREGDVRVFGQPPPDQRNADRWQTVLLGVAPYVEATLTALGNKLSFTPGLRLDPQVRSVSHRTPAEGDSPSVGLFANDFRVQPRLAVQYAPFRALTVRAAAGLNDQQPAPEDLSSVFGTPTLPSSHGSQWTLGAVAKLTQTTNLEVTGFYSEQSSLAVRSTAEAPLRANALVASGEGRAYGAQLLFRQQPWRGLSGWISYSISRSERRTSDQSLWRAFDYDQTHVATAVLSWSLPFGIELGARFRVATGSPRTEVIGATYDARRDRYQPLFGAQNELRIPVFVQLDARVSKRFRIGVSELELSLDVQNVTNQQNAEELVYNESFTQRGTISSLPILPNLGARWTF